MHRFTLSFVLCLGLLAGIVGVNTGVAGRGIRKIGRREARRHDGQTAVPQRARLQAVQTHGFSRHAADLLEAQGVGRHGGSGPAGDARTVVE